MTTTERDVLVEGTLVRLRRKRLADAAIDYSWRQDAALARYDAARPIVLTYEEFVAQYTEELSYPQPFRRTSAIEDHQGVHIGNVMYYNIDLHRREAELGITIGNPAYWGHGYGTESVTLLLNYIFTETTITRVYLHTLDWNVRAQRAFARAGFRDCGKSQRGEYRFCAMEVLREWFWDRDNARRAVQGGAQSPH